MTARAAWANVHAALCASAGATHPTGPHGYRLPARDAEEAVFAAATAVPKYLTNGGADAAGRPVEAWCSR